MREDIKIFFTKKQIRNLFILFIGTIIMAFLEVVGVASIAPFMGVVTNQEIILHVCIVLVLQLPFFLTWLLICQWFWAFFQL